MMIQKKILGRMSLVYMETIDNNAVIKHVKYYF